MFSNNLNDYVDLSTLSSPLQPGDPALNYGSFISADSTDIGIGGHMSSLDSTLQGQWVMSPGPSNPVDPSQAAWQSNTTSMPLGGQTMNGSNTNTNAFAWGTGMTGVDYSTYASAAPMNNLHGFQSHGFGGELLAGEGMDSVSDGLQAPDQGL